MGTRNRLLLTIGVFLACFTLGITKAKARTLVQVRVALVGQDFLQARLKAELEGKPETPEVFLATSATKALESALPVFRYTVKDSSPYTLVLRLNSSGAAWPGGDVILKVALEGEAEGEVGQGFTVLERTSLQKEIDAPFSPTLHATWLTTELVRMVERWDVGPVIEPIPIDAPPSYGRPSFLPTASSTRGVLTKREYSFLSLKEDEFNPHAIFRSMWSMPDGSTKPESFVACWKKVVSGPLVRNKKRPSGCPPPLSGVAAPTTLSPKIYLLRYWR